MVKTRVLLTGADSFPGSHVLAQLLSHDTVSVRAVVKSPQAAHALQQHYRFDPSTLDFFAVSEQESTIPGIFDDALCDPSNSFHAVVHALGTNLSDEADCLARFIKIQTEAILGFLRSIQDVSRTVRRVVIVASLIPFAKWLGEPHSHRLSGQAVNDQFAPSVDDPEYILAASQASNNIVNDAILAWNKRAGTQFDVVFITAPSIYGPAAHPLENSSDLTETNRRIWNICSNEPVEQGVPSIYGIDHFADVRDVAEASVRAIFMEKASDKRLIISAGVMSSGSEIAQLLTARFPELRGRIKMDGSPPRRRQRENLSPDFLDTYLLNTVLGITQLRSADISLTDIVRQILDLQRRKAWRSITHN